MKLNQIYDKCWLINKWYIGIVNMYIWEGYFSLQENSFLLCFYLFFLEKVFKLLSSNKKTASASIKKQFWEFFEHYFFEKKKYFILRKAFIEKNTFDL